MKYKKVWLELLKEHEHLKETNESLRSKLDHHRKMHQVIKQAYDKHLDEGVINH